MGENVQILLELYYRPLRALSRVLERKVIEEESRIRYDDTPISTYVEQISAKVRNEGQAAFTTLFDNASQRSRIISIFLAILELLRHHSFRAVQADDFGEIWILPPAADAEGETGRRGDGET